jgi:hypothetical protein
MRTRLSAKHQMNARKTASHMLTAVAQMAMAQLSAPIDNAAQRVRMGPAGSARQVQKAATAAQEKIQLAVSFTDEDRYCAGNALRLRVHIRKVPTLMGDTRRYWQRLAWHGARWL